MIAEIENAEREASLARELKVSPTNVCIVGSTLICGKGNDVDYLCLVPSDDCLVAAGFKPDIEVEYESDLASWRRNDVNIIATTDRGFFLSEIAIAFGAKVARTSDFDLNERAGRIAYHGAVRDAVACHLSSRSEASQ